MGCGSSLAESAPREVRKVVTALFCDLAGSTTLGEQHDAEVLRPLLDDYFAIARHAVERHGGRVEKFIGDAVVAIFGLPVAHEDDALRAVRAGLEIQNGLRARNDGPAIEITARVGITTGEALASTGRTPLIGDVMNTASRLQSAADAGQVLVGEPTWRLVRDAVAAEPVAAVVARGKARSVPAWRVLALAPVSPERTRGLGTAMVGREREGGMLAASYAHATAEQRSELFTVLGVAGAGKSRLVEEFLASLEDAEVLRGRCLSYGDGITWLPLADALRPALGLGGFTAVEDAAAAVRSVVAAEGQDAAAIEAGLGGLFGLPGAGNAQQTAWAVGRLLAARARVRPVILVLDDLHWAEAPLLDLVDHLAAWTEAVPILLLCMARPELLDVRPDWHIAHPAAPLVRLEPLSPADTEAMVDGLLGGGALAPEVRRLITSAAGGNPLFVEEIVRMLVDEGRIARDGDTWLASGEVSAIRVPPTVSALLSSRLDRLPESERALLEAASVEGQSFSVAAIEALVGDGTQPVSELLRALVRKELIVRDRDAGRDGYAFRHLLIRDAAYDAIPKSARARLHLAFAGWLEAAAGDAIAEHREVLGHHLAQAHRYREELGLPDDSALRMRAARALGEAGSRAFDELGDAPSAARLLGAAVALAPGTDEAARWDWFSEIVAPGSGRNVDRDVYGDDVADTQILRRSRIAREQQDLSSIDLAAARLEDERALALYRTRGARHLEVSVLMFLARYDVYAGDVEAACVLAREALQIAEECATRAHVEGAAADLLLALTAGPRPLGGIVEEAGVILRRWDGRLGSRWVLCRRADARALMGDAPGARADLAESARLAASLGLQDDGLELEVEPVIALAQGDAAGAASRFADALAASGSQTDRQLILRSYCRVLVDLGVDSEAERLVSPLATSVVVEERATHRSLLSRVWARRGDFARALALGEEARALVERTELEVVKAEVALDRAHVLLAAGRAEEARASADDALRRYREKEHQVGARRALAVLERSSTGG